MPAVKNDRPSLGFGNEMDTLDPAEFSAPRTTPKPSLNTTRQAAEASGFRSRESREPTPEKPKVQQRRRRTGRNAQLNIKAKPETIAAFQRIADTKGWGLGEAFEHATALLERDLATR